MTVPGETVSYSFEVGTTGQTFTRFSSSINNAPTPWNPTFTEIGNGFYRYSALPTLAGSYEWVGTATNGAGVTINFVVDSAEPLGQFVSGQDPVGADGGRITLRQGVSYSTALDNALIWTYTGPVSLIDATSITLVIHSNTVRITDLCTLTGSIPSQTITAELTGAQTDELLISEVTVYEVFAVIDGNEVVLFTGDVSVRSDVSP